MAKEKSKSKTGKKYKRLTLQTLFANGDEVWVKNRYHAKTGKEPANIVMEVRNGNMVEAVIVPPGNDPVCLTEQAVPKLLSECMDLYKLVRSGILEVLDPGMADEYYKDHVNRKEAVEDKINNILSHKENELVPKRPKLTKAQLGHTEVNPKVGDICLKARHAALTERQAMERLLEQEEVLTVNDLHYLQENGVFNKIQDWARDKERKLAEE